MSRFTDMLNGRGEVAPVMELPRPQRQTLPLPAHDDEFAPPSMRAPSINLDKLEDELTRNPLEEIAALVRSLTYGEMIEFATKYGQAAKIERPPEEIANGLHAWSKAVTA